MDLDFEELPQSGNAGNTAKWFQEHPDINAGKILDGLLGLKTEFPDESSNQGSTGTGSSAASSGGLEKPPEMGGLDHATANLLQMSVPDPSTTFLDIGTEIGGHSLYEDDPFNLETLLPSNFNVNQLDMLPSSPGSHHGHGSNHHSHHFQNNNNQHILNAHGAEASMAITAKAIMENNNIGHNLSIHSNNHHSQNGGHSSKNGHHQSAHQSIGMNLYPETTISPMSGPPGGPPHSRPPVDPMQPMGPFNTQIKTEPVAYIKREDNNNAPISLMQLHPPHHMLNEGYLLHHTTSPMSTGMSSPGSPPGGISNHEKNQAAMVMASLSSGGAGGPPRMGPGGGQHGLPHSPPSNHPHGGPSPHPGGHPGGQHPGGGKMRTPTPSTSRKKSANEPTPEEEELANIPSLQMRIKILQQRVCSLIIFYNACNYLRLLKIHKVCFKM